MFYQTTSEEHDGEETVAASLSRGEMPQGPASTVSVSSSSLKGTEGQRHRGDSTGAYGSQESNHSGTPASDRSAGGSTQAFIGPSPSHLSH